ncbi:MAG TPA: alpha/beta fold hydrolase [Verrucomicrobiae bacterium]|nr:alpha/beta fold hydrolase [Verrucomicrobiae bacterium]
MRGRLRWLLVSIIALMMLAVAFAIVAYATQRHWLPYAIVSATNNGRNIGISDRKPQSVTRQMRVEVGPPAASLSVWIIDPTTKASGTIFVLHGIHDRKTSMLGTGRLLARQGYRAVLVDLRGHGESSGKWLTYGAVESSDLSQVLDALQRENLVTGPVGVYGASYGAACALMFAGHDPRVRAVVSVASFATMRDEVPYFIRHASRMPSWLIPDDSIARAITDAGRLAGFDPKKASPLAAIQRTHAQVLLIQGEPDAKVSVDDARQLHAVATDHSQLVVTASPGHDAFFRDRDGLIARATTVWFAKWLGKPAAK